MRDRSLNCRVHNENYENDINHVLQVCQLFLRPIGIWPLVYSNASKRERICCGFVITACFSALCFVLIPSGYYLLFQEKDLNIRLKMFGPVGFCVMSIIKYCYLALKGPAFGRCLRHIQNDWKILHDQHHRAIMMENVAVGRNLTTLLAAFLYTGGFSYHTAMPLLATKRINENITIKILPFPGYDVFFDTQSSPFYEILFLSQFAAALVMYTVTTAECGLATIFVTHACGQIQIQMARLRQLIDDKRMTKAKFEDPLTVIVDSHVKTLRFSKDVGEVLREICLFEIVASTLLICIVEYYCVTEWKNNDAVATSTYFILLISFTFNILIFCYIGELLVEQCRKIGITSYEVEWYNMPGKEALDLILLIAISNYPPKLTAGRICDLSLTTFSSVLKSSMVYLNLLRTMVEWYEIES